MIEFALLGITYIAVAVFLYIIMETVDKGVSDNLIFCIAWPLVLLLMATTVIVVGVVATYKVIAQKIRSLGGE